MSDNASSLERESSTHQGKVTFWRGSIRVPNSHWNQLCPCRSLMRYVHCVWGVCVGIYVLSCINSQKLHNQIKVTARRKNGAQINGYWFKLIACGIMYTLCKINWFPVCMHIHKHFLLQFSLSDYENLGLGSINYVCLIYSKFYELNVSYPQVICMQYLFSLAYSLYIKMKT